MLQNNRRTIVLRIGIILKTMHMPGQGGENRRTSRGEDIDTEMDFARLHAIGRFEYRPGIDGALFIIAADQQTFSQHRIARQAVCQAKNPRAFNIEADCLISRMQAAHKFRTRLCGLEPVGIEVISHSIESYRRLARPAITL